MGKKSVPPPSASSRSHPVRIEDRVGGHLSIKVNELKRQLNVLAPGGEGAAIFEAHFVQSVAERWLKATSENSEDEGHIKGDAALVRAVRDDELLRCLLGEIVGITHVPIKGDDEVVTDHAESLAAKRAAKAAAVADGASPMAEA